MDQSNRRKASINPRENANLFSILTFFYTLDIFKKGYKKDLEIDDIYATRKDFRSRKQGNILEKYWDSEKRNNKVPSLYKIIWSCYGKTYLLLGVMQLGVKILIIWFQPSALGKFVAYFTPDQTKITKSDAMYNAGLLISLALMNNFFESNYVQIVKEFSIKVCTSFASLLYRKSLKLSPSALSEISVGRVVTLIIKDVSTFESAISFVNDMWNGVVIIIFVSYLIYTKIGVSAFAGIGFLMLTIPIQVYIGKKISGMRIETAKKTDDRIQVTQESLSAIKIIKMYTWERFFEKFLTDARKNEINKLKKIYYLKLVTIVMGTFVSYVSFCLLILTPVWLGNTLDAETVYFIITCFGSMRMLIIMSIPLGISQGAELFASLKRISNLLNAEELQKIEYNGEKSDLPLIYLNQVAVQIKDEYILSNVSINVKNGLNIITGSCGSGKSSLLKLILGEYIASKGDIKVDGSISYAPQEPWLFPSTIRQNILFGQKFDKERYGKILQVCALTHDINLFDKGDKTIVGDKGINLSKGQKARICLARACYKDSDIYLLDDCLTALDARINQYVFKECIKGFLGDKLVLFVSQNLRHIKEADHTLVLNKGTTLTLKGQKERLSKRITYYIDDAHDISEDEEEQSRESDSLLSSETTNSKNVYSEEKQKGQVSFSTYKKYYKFCGGFFVVLLLLVLFVLAQIFLSYPEKLLSEWVNLEANITALKTKNMTNTTEYLATVEKYEDTLNFYVGCILIATGLLLVKSFYHFFIASRASEKLHNQMVYVLLKAKMQFFDINFVGNILNRFSKDLSSIDEYIPFLFYDILRLFCLLVGIIVLISTVNGYFLLPASLFFIAICMVRKIYIPVGRSLRRLDAVTRSPMVGYLNTSLDGITTIRAFQTESLLRDEFDRHQDLFVSTWYMMQTTSRAFGFTLDLICTLFISILITYFLVKENDSNAGNVGLVLSQVVFLTALLSWMIKQLSELESQMTSVERVLEYTMIKVEDFKGRVVTNWPSKGRIEFKDVNLIYENTNEHILKNINFTIESTEKIGIVGRTGAGKSSIISCLFRLYNLQGQVIIDGEDTKTLSLDFLRSNIAIIPQDPILFSGTIRANIDPTNKYSDNEIWKAIKTVKLDHLVPSLDFKITESGTKYSSGQRQLICLARALITKNKIIVLDEATANMDPETDALLHKTIKEHFSNCTVITIAHRLHSIMNSSRVMVMDNGEVVEFDSPSILLSNGDGMFSKMVKQAGINVDE